MNIQEFLENISERVSTSASVKNVYGDPVVVGGRTVIPAARVRYGFGGGGGSKGGVEDQNGGGGGGGVVAKPCGALEITDAGARFIAFGDRKILGAALAIGFAFGAAVALLTRARSSGE